MSNLKMPEPVIWRYARQNTKTTAGPTYSTLQLKFVPIGFDEQLLHTTDALRDVLEQAAQLCDAQDGAHDHIYSAAIRALKEQVK